MATESTLVGAVIWRERLGGSYTGTWEGVVDVKSPLHQLAGIWRTQGASWCYRLIATLEKCSSQKFTSDPQNIEGLHKEMIVPGQRQFARHVGTELFLRAGTETSNFL